MGGKPSNIHINCSDCGPKQAKTKCVRKRYVKYCKKFIDPSLVTEGEKTLIMANLKAVRKFEKNHPLLPKCSREMDLASLLVDLIKRASPLTDAHSDKGTVKKIPVDGATAPAVAPSTESSAAPTESKPLAKKRKKRKEKKFIVCSFEKQCTS